MISSVEKIAFSAVATGGTLAEIDVSDAFQVAIAIDIDSAAGAGTNTAYVVPFEDQELGTSAEHIRTTNNFSTNTGIFWLGDRETATAEPAFENVFSKIRPVSRRHSRRGLVA